MAPTKKKQTKGSLSQATQDLGNSPGSSAATSSDTESPETPQVGNRQQSPDPATRLAYTALGGRKRVANGPKGARVTKQPSKAVSRRKKKTSRAYYVVMEGGKPQGVCKGWAAAQERTNGISGRWCQRFDSREDAQAFMDHPSILSSDEEEDEDGFIIF